MQSTSEAVRTNLIERIHANRERVKRLASDKLGLVAPNAKQWEFVNKRGRQVMLAGPNQIGGKTTALCLLISYDTSGLYPQEFVGQKFHRPIDVAIGGVSAKTVRNVLTDRLLGRYGCRGDGFIPSICIDEKRIEYGGQVKHGVEYFEVKHYTEGLFDGWSRVYCFTYKSGWELVQGYTLDAVYLDEEPLDFMWYDEVEIRTATKEDAKIRISETPTQGESEVYTLFEENESGEYQIIPYTIDDVTHLPASVIESQRNRYPEGHPLREARLYGRPVRGEGLALPTRSEHFLIDLPRGGFPSSYRWLIGVDFPHTSGWFAAAKICYDQENDIIYVVCTHKDRSQNSAVYQDLLRRWHGDVIPIAWPHDGGRVTDGSTIAKKYKRSGLNMLPDYAHWLVDGRKVFAIMDVIEDCIDRMESGRLKVIKGSCQGFLDEKRRYRLKDGVVKKGQEDHIIDALFKAILALRNARVIDFSQSRRFRGAPSRLRQPPVDFYKIGSPRQWRANN
jgi:hypothetical protein